MAISENPERAGEPRDGRSGNSCVCPPAFRQVISGWANSWLDRQDPRREAADRRARRYLARMKLLQQIIRTSAESKDTGALFEAVAGSLEERLPLDFCGVWRFGAGGLLELDRLGPAARSLLGELSGAGELERASSLGLEECLAGRTYFAPVALEEGAPFPHAFGRLGLASVVLAPMLASGQAFALVVAARREPRDFSRGECDFLAQLAQNVALAAHQSRLHRELEIAYLELRASQQAALERDRLRALGQMASGIAHDINNSISPAALHLDTVLERDAKLGDATREKLNIVRRAVQEVARTVSRMQELSHHEGEGGGERDPLQLNPLVAQVLESTRTRWRDLPEGRGAVIDVVNRLDPGLPAVVGDAAEIREALANLVHNAVDAMPRGGLLVLRTFATEVAGPHGSRQRQVVIEVGDSGVGMDEETRRRCLEPFFSTKGERGAGLGLPRVFEIAERHGATLEIETRRQKGTKVRLVFPAASGDSTGAVPQPGPFVPALRVLLIDDDRSLLETLQEVFAADGHQVEAAGSGDAGIATFRRALEEGAPFHLVVTDLGMPGLDGRQVAAAIREMASGTKIVLLTGWGHRILWKGEKLPDFDLVLAKPPRLKELRQAVLRLSR